ncbi:hypothetical protein DV096_07800 [Bradymonadaceae bacterium TMQ3]|uniref:Uncharacterized protein n=1 Tax=Lujinxingia sediminis TaxID=2480984 RepID=A0ABY0CT07_9DELT|nr:hypothetical protein [Lujinxingia sediminis]RDV38701.1 hypothetical protein DV096_07800 [Bradymonadaceae bacterium TMQ3]RVU44746.1 hypothetical protein EA187_09390 [Lujinxingia sediminis]TXC76526.1 hypothetical protein FRC91_07275 [Bradymonadales bacterium TMQ1]
MSDPIEILERRLKAVLDREQDTTGLHFFCQIGGNYDDLGIVTLQISGAGRLLLSWRLDDESPDLWSLTLSEDDTRRFIAMLLEHPFWTASPARRPRRDEETNVHFRICDQTVATYKGVQFWSGDFDEFPVLRTLTWRICRIIDRVSEGEIDLDDLQAASA